LGAGLDEVFVIVGHQSDQVMAVLADLPIRCLINQQYQLGRMYSVHVGWEHIPNDAQGVLICPADLPFLEVTEVKQVMDAFKQYNTLIIPYFNQQRGHPIVIPACYRQMILDYLPRGGCRAFIADHPHLIRRLNIDSSNIVNDLDVRNRQ